MIRFHKEGYKIIAITIGLVIITNFLISDPSWLSKGIFFLSIVFLILVLQFFRNPKRKVTAKENEVVEGVLIPNEINLVTPTLPIPGGITIKFNNIKLNVKTSDSDFN